QARQWNFGLEGPSRVGRLAPNGARVAQIPFKAGEAKRTSFARDCSDQSFAKADFCADPAFAVAIARQSDQPSAGVVPQQDAGVRKLEVFLERLQNLCQQRLEIARAIDSLRDELQSAYLGAHAIDRYVLFRFVDGFGQEPLDDFD